jgi:hypothetical protein
MSTSPALRGQDHEAPGLSRAAGVAAAGDPTVAAIYGPPAAGPPAAGPLAAEDVARFHRDGFVLVRGFYDRERDIAPIQRGARAVIELVRARHGLPAARDGHTSGSPETFDEAFFDEAYLDLLGRNRAWAGEVYDAVKQIPAFVRLVADPRHEAVFRQLRGDGAIPGLAAGGHGIRIDNPGEERYRADWHQEYHGQLRSPDGVTFWSSLVPVTEEMGPVRFCVGSHARGLLRVHARDPRNPDKTGAYGLVLEHRDLEIASYPQVAPLAEPGDLVLIDFAVLHSSGFNRGHRARWSLQSRYFNFAHPTGVRIGWCGSFAAGQDFRRVHPELVVPEAPSAAGGGSSRGGGGS